MAGTSRFEGLDLLRGIAAVAVVTLHAPRPAGTESLLPYAYLAVDLFFALSGFVIAHAYWQRLRDGLTVREFVIERLIRLYPLYLVAIVLGAFAIWSVTDTLEVPARSPEKWTAAFAANLFFLPAAPGHGPTDDLFPFAFPAWSLFWELIANIAFAMIAPRLTAKMLGGLLAAGLFLLILTAAVDKTLNVGITWADPFGGAPRVLWSFFAGVAIYRIYLVTRDLIVVPAWTLGAILTCSLLPPLLGWGYDLLLVILLFPPLILAGAMSRSDSDLSRWLARVSYAVYLFQAPFVLLLYTLSANLFAQHITAFPILLTTILLTSVTLAAASFATVYFDEPVRARLKGLLLKRRAPAALAPS